jgi:hypothetical protein
MSTSPLLHASPRLRLGLLAGFVAATTLAGCAPYPYPYYTPVPATPSRYDQSWDAALGAANDVGVQVTNADRGGGRITGNKGGAAVTITLQQMADGRVQVAFSAPDATDSNPPLSDRWTSAYNRRMGR